MPELAATSPLAVHPGRHGREWGAAGVRLRQVENRALVSLLATKKNDAALHRIAQERFEIALPQRPVLACGPQVSFLWSGHRQWLAMAPETMPHHLVQILGAEFGTLASLSEQSDGRFVVEVCGPDARHMLAKLAPIDLHPRSFKPDDTALTLFGHVGGQITQIDNRPTYEIMIFRGFADSVWHSLIEAGAEFGIDVDAGHN